MLRLSAARRAGGGSGGLLGKLYPGYEDKLWSRIDPKWKLFLIKRENDAFEKAVKKHRNFQKIYEQYKTIETKFAPPFKYRKPAVDWRRQLARGTLHIGRWYEGPHGSDYRPGNTVDRLRQLVPFTPEEWAERKKYRVWDGGKLGLGLWALWLSYRLTQTYPVVWC